MVVTAGDLRDRDRKLNEFRAIVKVPAGAIVGKMLSYPTISPSGVAVPPGTIVLTVDRIIGETGSHRN
jgi:hypothetical protein